MNFQKCLYFNFMSCIKIKKFSSSHIKLLCKQARELSCLNHYFIFSNSLVSPRLLIDASQGNARFLELQLQFPPAKAFVTRICIPVGSSSSSSSLLPLLRMYFRFEERTMGNRYGSDIWYVSLSCTRTSRSVVCSCSQCVIERHGCDARFVQFSKNCIRRPVTDDRRRSGVRMCVRARANIHCETRKMAISWSLDYAENRRPANPVPVSVAHRLTSRLTLASADSAPLNYCLGINSSSTSRSLSLSLYLLLIRGTCRGFIPLFVFPFFRTPYNEGIKASRAAGVQI